MNYSESLKNTLLENEPKKLCCNRALACGLLVSAALLPSVDGTEETIAFKIEQEAVAALAVRLVKARFGKDAELSEGMRPGHKVYTVSFRSKPVRKLLTEMEGDFPEDIPGQREVLSLKCPECRASFLRGLFIGCGSVTDPETGFHLEFMLPASRAEAIARILSIGGTVPNRVKRREKVGLYYKKSTLIGEFFSIIGENSLYFDIADKEMERQVRAVENRLNNFEMKNLEKTVNASLAQIAAVKELFLSGEIERLPQELRETAVLRLEYDDYSLARLAECHVPPITKSGLNNRLRRIMEAARDVREDRMRREREEDESSEQ